MADFSEESRKVRNVLFKSFYIYKHSNWTKLTKLFKGFTVIYPVIMINKLS